MEKEQLISLIGSAQSGNQDAINTLFGEVYNDIYYFALKTVKDSDLACDITQEALIDIFNNIKTLQDPVAFPAWSRQITYRQCTRHFRKKKDVLLEENEDDGSIFDTIEEENIEFIPDKLLDQKDFRQIVMNFIDTLSEEQRSAVLLYYFEERSIGEIAQIQNVSEGTVKSRLNYARKTIKALVEDYEQKHDIKLHALPFFPFMRWIFAPDKAANLLPASAVQSAAASVGASVSGSVAATATVSATVTSTTAATAAKATSIPLVTKIISGIVAAGVIVGGAVVTTNIIKENNTETVNKNNNQSTVQNENELPSVTVGDEIISEGVIYNYQIDTENNLRGWVAVGLEETDDDGPNSLYIPDKINQIPVIGIESNLCVLNDTILSAEIHCKIIPQCVFNESKLEKLVIGSEVESVGWLAFGNCSNLTDVTIQPGNQTFEHHVFFNSAFYNDPENLENDMLIVDNIVLKILPREVCIIPEGVTHIAKGAVTAGAVWESGHAYNLLGQGSNVDHVGFQTACQIIKEVYLPASLKNIQGYVFHSMVEEIHISSENPYYYVSDNCLIETATKTLVLGSRYGTIPSDGSVTVIGEYAFGGWTLVVEPLRIVLPDNIEEIGDCAFTTTNLIINKLPDNLCKIGSNVFSPGTDFEDTTIPSSLTDVGEEAFKNTNIEYP